MKVSISLLRQLQASFSLLRTKTLIRVLLPVQTMSVEIFRRLCGFGSFRRKNTRQVSSVSATIHRNIPVHFSQMFHELIIPAHVTLDFSAHLPPNSLSTVFFF